MYKSIVIRDVDNVATALEDIPANEPLCVRIGEREVTMCVNEPIQFGHKFAISPIAQGAYIYKYGEVIGKASQSIAQGDYVHVHNLEGTRGRGDQ